MKGLVVLPLTKEGPSLVFPYANRFERNEMIYHFQLSFCQLTQFIVHSFSLDLDVDQNVIDMKM